MRLIGLIGIISLWPLLSSAQIKVGGNVYGGGNKGAVKGSTNVKVRQGDLQKVFGGARMGNVSGNSYVNIDGKNAEGYMVINHVYGGNDIAGKVGTGEAVSEGLPAEIAGNEDHVDNTWNSYVHLSSKMTAAVHYTQDECNAYNTANNLQEGDAGYRTTADIKTPATLDTTNEKVFIGQLFAGGNGDYDYVKNGASYTEGEGEKAVTMQKYDVYQLPRTTGDKSIATITAEENKPKPELDKTYLDVQGGTIVYAYGGGNNATVKEQAVIHVDNPSEAVSHILVNETTGVEADATTYNGVYGPNGTNEIPEGITDLLSTYRLRHEMGVNMSQEHVESDEFQVGRMFGGNNMAEMAIRPLWNLQSGKIRNLYSGGNRGNMTCPDGLLLEINPNKSNYYPLKVDNVYGGCRMADVRPMRINSSTGLEEDVDEVENLDGYKFPRNLAARVLVRGGDINHVYGGNDVRGKVYFGNAIGVYTSIRGNIYGGGNGSYPYTDRSALADTELYGDLYYDPKSSSIDELNKLRPNAEQVSIRVAGEEDNPTLIHGSIYCGGNSATLKTDPAHAGLENYPLVELKIGSHVIADKVFLGNNGESMVTPDILEHYAGTVDMDNDGIVVKNSEGALDLSHGIDFSSLTLTQSDSLAKYMNGAAMDIHPRIVFDDENKGDPATYKPYTTYIGSFFCGGNVGSMTYEGTDIMDFNTPIYIFDKVVGGCNNANVPAKDGINARYEGGLIGSEGERGDNFYTHNKTKDGKIRDRLVLNFNGLRIEPKRWNADKSGLEWNTAKWDKTEEDFVPIDIGSASDTSNDKVRRLLNGNVYGGCYESGHVNGNVVINIESDLIERDKIFADTKEGAIIDEETGEKEILVDDSKNRNSGVIQDKQSFDIMTIAMAVFGAGYGKDSEIWGSTTVNLNEGYTLQIFGGGEKGVVGKHKVDKNGEPELDDDDNYTYEFDPRYSTTVNLKGSNAGYSPELTGQALAETEYLYGGGNEGLVCGNTLVNLGDGRIYDAFGGASDADILGHTEVFIGREPDGSGGHVDGFPWIRDIVYGGNDFGGTIWGEYEDDYDFTARIKNWEGDKKMIYGYIVPEEGEEEAIPNVLKSSSYVEYLQGRVDTIFGGGYGSYDYTDTELYGEGCSMPVQESSFVHIRPNTNTSNALLGAFGGGTGHPGNRHDDKAQDRSYVLINIPNSVENFRQSQFFGSGSYNGMGMRFHGGDDGHGGTINTFLESFDPDQMSAVIDLWRGQIGNVFGGSFHEGITARTVVNVPEGSTITMYTEEPDYDDPPTNQIKHVKEWGNIFGGAYGTHILPPCDVFESNVNYRSRQATVKGSIFGGNNHERRTLYANVNIYSPVYSNPQKGYTAVVYGAGQGQDTWAEYTEVNLWPGAEVYEVYGGGMMGHVLNAESVQTYMQTYTGGPSDDIATKDPFWSDNEPDDDGDRKWELDETTKMRTVTEKYKKRWAKDWADAWEMGGYFKPNAEFDNYKNNYATNLNNDALVRVSEIGDPEIATRHYNTNVKIHEGAKVAGYAYGGGYGKLSAPLSGDVYGTTYIGLLGGTVTKDLYAAGTSGAVYDLFAAKDFVASANVFVRGGSVRNVYGGGWEGNVGRHDGALSASMATDIPGETHVVIGRSEDDIYNDSILYKEEGITKHGFYYGRPAIQRNVYGGGEGGAVFGTTNTLINNGYIGYVHLTANQKTNEQGAIVDAAASEGLVERYEEKIIDDTYKDPKTEVFIPNTNLTDAGCVFGGGYVDDSSVDKTKVKIYDGHIRNSIFGGGEIAAIGRGDMKEKSDGTGYELNRIYRPGKTNIEMFGGHVYRNVYGGGRGYDNLGRYGHLHADGCIFGQTEVHIHGGEIGTVAGVADGDGNVFGGGDIGYVYSAYEYEATETIEGIPTTVTKYGLGKKEGVRYDPLYQGYYYKFQEGNFVTVENPINHKMERQFTEDCKVLVEPYCKVLNEYTLPNKDGDGNLIYVDGVLQTTTHTVTKVSIVEKEATEEEEGITHEFSPGEYVPIKYLNLLKNKSADADIWNCLDPTGIIIHNAVFAGGNTPSGKAATNANTASVFGNATASINDVYHRDLITLGTRHTGGLYGDGNLTLVDGYRELNITNYGTDYYSIAKEISIDAYHALPEREADYYELKYTCIKACDDKDGTHYLPEQKEGDIVKSKASTITADEMQNLFVEIVNGEKVSVKQGTVDILVFDKDKQEWVPNTADDAKFWEESGVLPVYAGRLMNSIQRADLCGVFGSRMVMQGAQDRVPEEVDFTNYTINRVREVSLNKVESLINDDYETYTAAEDPEKAGQYKDPDAPMHGNYFGIYNVVNYLGALTSDVDFGDENGTSITEGYHKRTTDNTDTKTYGPDQENQTFYMWKKNHYTERKRNNGNSHNKVALASGVYLEITTEESTGNGLYEKVWGPITGVIELDLINVSTGIGGGFVYAKNIHGVRSKTDYVNTTLTALNKDAVTHWDFDYKDPDTYPSDQKEWETSGNFVHSTQTIIDDCYNVSNRYVGDNKVPAHYWYIKGSVYVYDQYISAYTGTPNAYSESVDIPLTIAAASHGTMKLLNVMPNRYAYYATPGVPLADGKKIVINDKPYYKNDPISYWDWYLLSNSEKELFIEKTYVNCVAVNIDDATDDEGNPKVYPAGTYIMTEAEYNAMNKNTHTYKNADGEIILNENKDEADTEYIFRLSNNASHDEGFILTYEVNNPSIWDNWFTPKSGDYKDKITLAEYNNGTTVKANYEDGPTYRLKAATGGELLGQISYDEGDVIAKDIYTTYQAVQESHSSAIPSIEGFSPESEEYAKRKQASFEKAYIVTTKITVPDGSAERYYNPGMIVSETFANSHGSCEEAYICTKTIELTSENLIYKDTKLKASEVTKYINDVNNNIKGLPGITDENNITEEQIAALSTENKKKLTQWLALKSDLTKNLVPAYYCTDWGLYGGNYYESGNNYRGLEAWSSMSEADREKFIFNYDALDLLIDPNFTNTASGAHSEGHKYQYDGPDYTTEAEVKDATNGNKAGYSVKQSVDYTATYNGDTDDKTETEEGENHNKKYMSTSAISGGKVYVDQELSREEFESLPNEQRHYSPIVVAAAGTYYVVKTAFQIGSTPYAVGEVISSTTYSSLPPTEQSYVTSISFSAEEAGSSGKTYYYCREPYTIATGGSKVKNIKDPDPDTNTYDEGEEVPLGAIISASSSDDGCTGYSSLKNQQKNFTIHGVAPTETSTLYVSRESNIYDLSKEKIITVIYQYDYDETDATGNVTPVSERHVVNIHLTFKSGVPIVEDINKPDIILPGDYIGIREPNVIPCAYEVTGGGWELFATKKDAESHHNGVEFTPAEVPLYWYQDGYYVAYYAKSYLGRTYSNSVPVSVANYHDLANVMSKENKAHHMYIDHKNVKRDSKIYINDYSKSGKNGLDLLKNLFDLSLIEKTYNQEGEPVPVGSGEFEGHIPLESRVKGGDNLEFFLRTDIDHSKKIITNPAHASDPSAPETIEVSDPWTSIGTDTDQCFEGTFHGDGHTISGLTSSLFNKLCGNVYNLGVTGSFTGAGVAETGSGYVENCWVMTTGTPDDDTYAVFGNPEDGSYEQVVNCYYPESNRDYKTGKAFMKPDKAFYNGEVAYDLNGFYLYKRYSDKKTTSGLEYKYWKTGESEPQTAFYNNSGMGLALCSSGYNNLKYVEDRFANEDFLYAAGTIPGSQDERYHSETIRDPETNKDVEVTGYYPIWPDDYLFFGQALNYDHVSGHTHQPLPSVINKSGNHIVATAEGNRVYRAPAYFGDSKMDMAHFNTYAVFAQSKKNDASVVAYKDMTAIDFTGGNGDLAGGYKLGWDVGKKLFYQPLLDDDGVNSFTNIDLTQNLLAYTAEPDNSTASGITGTTVSTYLLNLEPTYSETPGYRSVAYQDPSQVRGHWVKQIENGYLATSDHMLVDLQDFNAPMAYSFDDSHLMWHQRKPDTYVDHNVDHTTGWEAVSLPFTAELVTTNQKGEITHFYSDGEKSKNDTKSLIGHEYWLRNFTGITNPGSGSDPAVAKFNYPISANSDPLKTATNTFLWDYYYKGASHNQKDLHDDTYQTYYKTEREYEKYPLLAKATPYLIGFPGVTYYEFDLSGNFNATTTAESNPVKLGPQTITFASNKGERINVSDSEMEGVTYGGFTYKPNYKNLSFEAGSDIWTRNADGGSYDKVPAAPGLGDPDVDPTPVMAFRPYFTTGSGSRATRSIIFSNDESQKSQEDFEEQGSSDSDDTGRISIRTSRLRIAVKSTLKHKVDVRILTLNGLTVTTFALEPGETVETRLSNAGVYIVRTTDGKFQRKLTVR